MTSSPYVDVAIIISFASFTMSFGFPVTVQCKNKSFGDSSIRRKDGANSTQETIDLEKITMPVLNIVGDFDDICPPAASLPVEDMVAARDKSTVKVPCGHIELSVSAYAHERLWPQVVEWLSDRD